MKFKHWFINEVKIDNKEGLGVTDLNKNIHHFGIKVLMKPSKFLSLTTDLATPDATLLTKMIYQDDKPIASPFLGVKIPKDWKNNNFEEPAEVIDHEGRHRMLAILNKEGDNPIEVHIAPQYYRNKHMTEDWIKRLKQSMIKQRNNPDSDPKIIIVNTFEEVI